MKRISLLVAVAMPLLVLPGGALAGDAKVVPGTVCQAVVGASAKAHHWDTAYDYSGINLPASHDVVCPLVRESSTTVLNEVRVRLDRTTLGSGTVSCKVHSQSDDAGSQHQTDPIVHTGGDKEMVFAIDGLDHYGGGTFSVHCTLSPSFSIINIRHSED